MPCPDCSASGVVDKETGEPLALEELVLQLRLWLDRAMEENRRLKSQLADKKPENNIRGYGPFGARYHGD